MTSLDYSPTIHAQQRQTLANVLQQKKFCDVTFIVGVNEVEFPAIRALLAAISPVFETMLFGNMKESEPNAEIAIPDIDAEAFQCVVNFAYCNDPQITAANVLSVHHICDKYQINALSKLCAEFFSKCLQPENICFLLSDAIKLKSEHLVQQCRDSLAQFGSNPSGMLNSEGFLRMSVSAMQILLESDHLQVDEEELWSGVLKWAKHQKQNPTQDGEKYNDAQSECGKKLLKAVCPCIRFGLMSSKYFVKNVKPFKCLTDAELINILCYQVASDTGYNCTFSTKKRIRFPCTGLSSSSILSDNEAIKLGEWIKAAGKSNASLLFRASRDGFTSSAFHGKCDNQGATLCVIRSEHNHVFGGYTEISWKPSGDWSPDSKAWIFLIRSARGDTPRQWRPTKYPNDAVYPDSSYGPTFGNGHDLNIADNCNVNNSSYSNFGHTYASPNYNADQPNIVLAGSRNFKVTEYEVWKLT